MSDSKQHPFSSRFWRNFEHFFGGELPDLPHGKVPDPEWVNEYVRDVMQKAFVHGKGTDKNGTPRTEVFETHNSVIVKVYIPDRKKAAEVIVLAGIRQIKLENMPNNRELTIPLPAHVIPESCKAVYKEGILQLHLRKAKISGRMHEVFIQFKD